MNNIISKLKHAGLIGRGGACFPVWQKWSAVAKAMADKKGSENKCFVICNASEGEPDVKKDFYILKKHPEKVIAGMLAAMAYLGSKRGYLYIKADYYRLLKAKLEKAAADTPIEVLIKPREAGYIGGEESSILNAIEGKRIEPRLKPPFPFEKGLFGLPTLLNNVETFYNVALVLKGTYRPDRFVTIIEQSPKPSFKAFARLRKIIEREVFLFPKDWTVEKILKKSGRLPSYKFFVQLGGGASGIVLNSAQLKNPLSGSGSITIYSLEAHDPIETVKRWIDFFCGESCGKCVPCREGTFRVKEQLEKKDTDWPLVKEILDNLKETSFCGLGCSAPIAITSYFNNVFPLVSDKDYGLGNRLKTVCECFS
ncbi:MAG: NADH-ubiquinone oxidoreductase-F iron-sulfur binding region domain-containing protein [Patescibacteria group bacterium]|jgi:NADH:ubiquinone oxidoreductase subunit F (NADH-binding)